MADATDDNSVTDPAARLQALHDKQERRIILAFLAAIGGLRSDIDLTELAGMLERGNLDQALEMLAEIGEKLGIAVNAAFVDAATSTSNFLTANDLGRFAFDPVNPVAVDAMQTTKTELANGIAAEQRKATSRAIVSGIKAGNDPIAQAKNFVDSIGLNAQQWQEVETYRAALEQVASSPAAVDNAISRAIRDKRTDAQIQRAAREAKPFSPEKIDEMVQGYIDRKVKARAQMIGELEGLRAVQEGGTEGYRQALESGSLAQAQITRRWKTIIDDRERQTHHDINGQEKLFGEPWVTIEGELRYPGDPEAPLSLTAGCRCGLETVIQRA